MTPLRGLDATENQSLRLFLKVSQSLNLKVYSVIPFSPFPLLTLWLNKRDANDRMIYAMLR